MNLNSKEQSQQALNRLLEEFFNNGGVVTKCEKYARSENVEYNDGWRNKRKKSVDS